MIRWLLLGLFLLVGSVSAQAAPKGSTDGMLMGMAGNVVVNVNAPAPAAAVGFTTLALNSDFSQAQPSGWFACSGGAAGAQWYQGITGGDTVAAPCTITGGQPGPATTSRFNLITDPLTSHQVLDFTFKLTDLAPGLDFTSMQTADDSENAHNSSIPCCVQGELFPYGFYMEAKYRILTNPDYVNGATGGVWSAFWQGGQGLSPFTNPHGTTIEIDHPEQHSELMFFDPGFNIAGPNLAWAIINWFDGSGGGYFGPGGSSNDYVQLEDPRQYHVFGVRVTTNGSSELAICSYRDGVQVYCAQSVVNNSAQYAEKKYPIIFIGISCYFPGSVQNGCLNIPITRWYNCSGSICFSPSAQPWVRFSDNLAFSVSGVTGGPSLNGSWFAVPFSNGTGGTDYFISQGANDPTATMPSWPGGSPTGGTLNVLNQVDMYIDHISVWTCSSWASNPCFTAPDIGSP